VVVGGVGRLVGDKGCVVFVEAARGRASRATFVWVGPEDEAKPDVLRAAALAGPVRFLGVRHDMPDVYAALDVFVLPSWREGFSRSGMEAAASGLPMVLSDIRGCREIGTDGEHVMLVPPRHPDLLTSVIAGLLDDPDLRKTLGAAARSRAMAEFDQRRVATRSLETYVRAARDRGLDWRLETAS
jgi:glycosyltransferase involved in cell wall biosynthesis